MISAQHDENVTLDQLRTDLMEKVVKVVVPKKYLDNETKYHMQPSGKFVIGGPQVFLFSSSFKSMAVHLIKKNVTETRVYMKLPQGLYCFILENRIYMKLLLYCFIMLLKKNSFIKCSNKG